MKTIGSEFWVFYPRFKVSVEDIKELGTELPQDVIEDIEFFVLHPDITPLLLTNTRLAYRIGKLKENSLTRAIHQLFLARDCMIKGAFPANVDEHLNECEIWLRYLISAKDNLAFELTERKQSHRPLGL